LRSQPTGKKLAVILPWAQSKSPHIAKYSSIYTRNGFDVLVVSNRSKNIIVPKRTQEIAGNVIKFLENNESYSEVLVHGFSAGGYVWGECLVKLHESEKSGSTANRIKGQVWDSIASVDHVSVGISNSFFRQNKFMETLLRKSIEFILAAFFETITKYYYRSSTYFLKSPVRAPVLIFASKIDQIGTASFAKEMAECFESNNIKATLKVFPDSKHVQHYQQHKEEYEIALLDHMKKCSLMN
jgi:alpha/beta superfamily hydrolase